MPISFRALAVMLAAGASGAFILVFTGLLPALGSALRAISNAPIHGARRTHCEAWRRRVAGRSMLRGQQIAQLAVEVLRFMRQPGEVGRLAAARDKRRPQRGNVNETGIADVCHLATYKYG
ncbi:hypothetical protein [Bordetella sp. LUAb4]|uniref:hypothetical protein n=1 Tax=Bordetella sp. LUAb4 TaxID=2843195 RepID=UPI001E49F35B|nr:hypothetical protein [Bordetella sp. LUAb4]